VVKRKKSDLTLQNKRLLKKLKRLSLKDPLTGLYNYQYLIERLGTELKHAQKYIFPVSLIMIDIDYFRSINDTYGYRAGNRLLKEFTHYLNKFARRTDIIARCSGATFVLLSPNTNKGGALALGHRINEKVQKHIFRLRKNRVKLKISIGIVNFPEDDINSVAGLVDAADKALRDAKEKTANKISGYKTRHKKAKGRVAKKEVIEDLKAKLRKAGRQLDQALLESVYAFAKAIEARDHYTGEHAEKMINIVKDVAKELPLSKKETSDLEHAAVLHDLGKIGINDKILHKKGRLTKKERNEVKKHPLLGAEIIRSIHFLRDVVPMVLYHHERFDGKGYASGLKGNEIPLGARILAIADVYQALISDRPYRKALSKRKALKIIKEGSGKDFDPDVVHALIKSILKRQKSKSKKA